MKAGRRLRPWRDPCWWVSVELTVGIWVVALAIVAWIGRPAFIGTTSDVVPTDAIAALGLAVGFGRLIRIATPPHRHGTSYLG